MAILRIYTDGACSGNQNENNIGGWGSILEFGPHKKELRGGEANTTNNRMEMAALLEALKAITKPGQTIEVFSDSSYLMNCFREKWYEKWVKNGWMTSKKEPVENKDLWEELLPFLESHDFNFYRVKGHVSINWHLAQMGDEGAKISEAVNGMAEYPDPLAGGSGQNINNVKLPPHLEKTYDKFREWNGSRFTVSEFLYITKMNNRADALANQGMDPLR